MTATLSDAMTLMMQGGEALARVEAAGLRVDTAYLDRITRRTERKIARLERRLEKGKVWRTWEKTFGVQANLNSGPQLGTVLFDKLRYPGRLTENSEAKKADPKHKRVWQTDEESLHRIDNPWIKLYLERKKLLKLTGTYFEGIKRETCDGFIHPFFHLAGGDDTEGGAVTYRGSSSLPNFQNVPIRHPVIGKLIRQAVIPRPGCRLVEIDYGAMEFIIAACKWKDPKMMAYAADESKDVHSDWASKLFKMDAERTRKNKPVRFCGKTYFVFPILYGSDYINITKTLWEAIDKFGLKNNDSVPMREYLANSGIEERGRCKRGQSPEPGTFEKHVKEVQERFMGEFSTFARSADAWYRRYRDSGRVRLMTGFEACGLFSKNFILNVDVQGPAFHCLLWSVIQTQRAIRREKKKSLVVAQIHDCELGDVPDAETQWFLTTAKRIMTIDIRKAWPWISIPLKAEVDVTPLAEEGGNWWRKQPWVCSDNGVWGPK